jgi:hypothetical protein
MAFTKKGGKAVGKWSGRGAAEAFRRATQGTKAQELMRKAASARLPGFAGKSIGGKALTLAGYASGLSFARWGAQRGIGAAGLRFAESERDAVKKAEDKYKGAIPERLASAIRDPKYPSTDRIAALNQAIEDGKIKDVKDLGVTDDEFIKLGKSALRVHPDQFKKIRDAFPHLAEKMGEGFSEALREKVGIRITDEDRAAGIENVASKIVSKMKPAAMAHMDENALDNKNVQVAIHHYGTGAHISQLAQSFGKKFIDGFQKQADALDSEFSEFYERNNPSLAKYLDSSAARGLGLSKPSKKKKSETFEGGGGI